MLMSAMGCALSVFVLNLGSFFIVGLRFVF